MATFLRTVESFLQGARTMPQRYYVGEDVFAMEQVTAEGGKFTADLRDVPARVYASLPTAIDSLKLIGPEEVAAGEPIAWHVDVLDRNGRPIPAAIPLEMKLLAEDGAVLVEKFAAVLLTFCSPPGSSRSIAGTCASSWTRWSGWPTRPRSRFDARSQSTRTRVRT